MLGRGWSAHRAFVVAAGNVYATYTRARALTPAVDQRASGEWDGKRGCPPRRDAIRAGGRVPRCRPHACRRRALARTLCIQWRRKPAMVEVYVGAFDVKTKEKSVLSQSLKSFFRVCAAELSLQSRRRPHAPLSAFLSFPNTHTLLPPMAPKADKQKKAQDKAKQAARQKVSEKKRRGQLTGLGVAALPIRGATDLGFERAAMERGGEAGVRVEEAGSCR